MMSRTLKQRWQMPDLSAFEDEIQSYLNAPTQVWRPKMRNEEQEPQSKSSEELRKLGNPLAPGSSSRPPVASSVPSGDLAAQIRQGMLDRGLPEHVADGFLMNFQDESGLNPGINEQNPLVEGSRGGYGLYQLTGPRRVAYEAYADGLGVPYDDWNAQLDFMVDKELRGTESRAAKAIFNTPDRGTAAAAIATDFLRPAPEHLKRRVAKYTRG